MQPDMDLLQVFLNIIVLSSSLHEIKAKIEPFSPVKGGGGGMPTSHIRGALFSGCMQSVDGWSFSSSSSSLISEFIFDAKPEFQFPRFCSAARPSTIRRTHTHILMRAHTHERGVSYCEISEIMAWRQTSRRRRRRMLIKIQACLSKGFSAHKSSIPEEQE